MKRLSAPLAALLVALAAPAFADETSAPVAEQGATPFTVHYRCAGERTLTVRYPAYADAGREPIELSWRGQRYRLTLVKSGSGARYANRQLIWWSKGDDGFLTTRGGRMIARDCRARP
ncbi:MliC family protein [Crenobacter luteus]|uniref:C-type lysozyme inhibitor domain-containing protein n=1 Tax=Crenobacter luteus TaxID=1452487 RepID=A0A161SI43_9NEIS|nr:MliC family protein [Crenobacter luteus]KZE33510.1 hypothetical protein AVW16_08200 [Crenobacter luteus]